LSVTDEPQTFF